MKYSVISSRAVSRCLVLACLFVVGATAPAFAAADVVATFDPNGGNLTCQASGRSCVTLDISIRFKNEGDEPSAQRNVSLNRFNGTRASGYAMRFGGSGAFRQLPALAPGQTTTLTWTARGIGLGKQTYKPVYSPPLNEGGGVKNTNHNVTVTYDVQAASGGSGSGSSSSRYNRGSSSGQSQGRSYNQGSSSSSSGGDVVATFVHNGTVPCDTPTASNTCAELTIQIRYKNQGTAESAQRRVSLNKFNGRRASGYAQRYGGSGAFQTLPALAPGAETTLSWTARRVQVGQYTFKPVYSPALNEGGGIKNTNHNVTQTLQVVSQ